MNINLKTTQLLFYSVLVAEKEMETIHLKTTQLLFYFNAYFKSHKIPIPFKNYSVIIL